MGAAGSPPPASLLSLPYEVRKRIYFFADLIQECPVTIIPHSQRRQNSDPLESPLDDDLGCAFAARKNGRFWYGEWPECSCPPFPKQLLLVCKSLHAEVEDVLYGENKFVISTHQEPMNVRLLLSLSTRAVRALRHLAVRLNSWPCAKGHPHAEVEEEDGECYICPAPVSSSDPEILVGESTSEELIQEWDNVCEYLADTILPGQLHLEFIADVGDRATAQRLMKPMVSLPRLKQCIIRLGREEDPTLHSLAYETATGLTKDPDQAALPLSHSFSLLPREIRLRILWFTNLAPGGLSTPRSDAIFIVDGIFDQPNISADRVYDGNAMRRCCMRCSFTATHCSCPLYFASYNPVCECRMAGLNLFLVNHQLYRDASEVLFSSNTFCFYGDFEDTQSMLMSVPRQSLKHIRRMRFSFLLEQTTNWGDNESGWHSLLYFINTNCNPSNMLIQIEAPWDYEYISECYLSEKEALEELYHTYVGIARGLKVALPNIRDLHIFLDIMHSMESFLEKFVMGSTYDSESGNRYPKVRMRF